MKRFRSLGCLTSPVLCIGLAGFPSSTPFGDFVFSAIRGIPLRLRSLFIGLAFNPLTDLADFFSLVFDSSKTISARP